jgi:uncharacterized membrane protein
MEAACTSEMSIHIQLRTQQYISEDSEVHTCHRENLKSHIITQAFGHWHCNENIVSVKWGISLLD